MRNPFKRKLDVRLHNLPTTSLNGADSIVIQIDPQFADMSESIANTVAYLIGHNRVAVIPISKESMSFYTIDVKNTVFPEQYHVPPAEAPVETEAATSGSTVGNRVQTRDIGGVSHTSSDGVNWERKDV